jgi:LDH2 family malate/lactate/ureidoglycolate dehydrogenase
LGEACAFVVWIRFRENWLGHGETFLARLAALDGVLLPGDRRTANRRRIATEGVALPAKLWAETLAAGA